MAIEIENENNFQAALRSEIVFFVGSGFSVLARNASGMTLPVGPELQSALATHFNDEQLRQLTLPEVAEVLMGEQRDAFIQFLRRTYSVASYDPLYESLFKVGVSKIFTTNIDDLLPKLYAASEDHYLQDLELRGPAFGDRKAVLTAALHGSVAHNDNRFDFSPTSLASAFNSDPGMWLLLTQEVQRAPTLFWGSNLTEPGVLQALSPASARQRQHRDKWVVLRERNPARERVLKAQGFQVILGDTKSLLEYFRDVSAAVVQTSAHPKHKRLLLETFPEYRIPEVGKYPNRPVEEFFAGADPSWSDVYSNVIHQTEHLRVLRDRLNAQGNAIITGIPATGKTTLLMQGAAHFETKKFKLYLPHITSEKATLLARSLYGREAILFVDDVGDCVDALEPLLKLPNVQFVVADREYNIEYARDKLPHAAFKIINVTELSERDANAVLTSIPAHLRAKTPQQVAPVTGDGRSVAEIYLAHAQNELLKKRYNQFLKGMAERNDYALQLLVLAAYFQSCRSAATLDVVLGYFGGAEQADAIYKAREALGTLVCDMDVKSTDSYAGTEAFVLRSRLTAETILKETPSQYLRQVITGVFQRVSNLRVFRFDAFRKRAYDADLTDRAFSKWQDGEGFYDAVYERVQNPWMLQQGALFLMRKRRFDDAFLWIEEALARGGGRIFAIRASHAIILFRANIDKPELNAMALRSLAKSMEILEECHAEDKRKSYHAREYARQAVEFAKKVGRNQAREYLENAKSWLEDELDLPIEQERTKRLLNQVERALK